LAGVRSFYVKKRLKRTLPRTTKNVFVFSPT
jgi:hypothetical protein